MTSSTLNLKESMIKSTVSRDILQQELQKAQDLSAGALNAGAFGGGMAGTTGLFAQLATAGIGAFAQNRIKKQLAEREIAEQQSFANLTGVDQGIAAQLGPEGRQAVIAKQLASQFDVPERKILETEQGIVAIDPRTFQAQPIMAGGQVLKPFAKSKTVVNVGAAETEEQKAVGKFRGERYSSIIESGDQASNALATLDDLEKAVQNPDTAQGAFAGIRTNSKKVADLFGVEVKGLNDDAIIAAVGNKLALQLRNPRGADGGLTGSTSDRDLQFLIESVPNKNKTREQNLALIELAKRDKQRTIDTTNFANNYFEQTGSMKGFDKAKKQFLESRPLASGEDKERLKGMLTGTTQQPQPTGGIKFLGFE